MEPANGDMFPSSWIALAEAIPAEKYSWRPAPGVRSVSEVFMHIAISENFGLLSFTGPKMPADMKPDLEKNRDEEGGCHRLAEALAGCGEDGRVPQLKPGRPGPQGQKSTARR